MKGENLVGVKNLSEYKINKLQQGKCSVYYLFVQLLPGYRNPMKNELKITVVFQIISNTDSNSLRPQLYGLGYPRQPSPERQLYRAFICENVVSVGRVKVLPA